MVGLEDIIGYHSAQADNFSNNASSESFFVCKLFTLYMLLELKVLWFPENYDPDSDENLGKKVKLEPGILVVNTDHIASFSPNTRTDNTMIRLDSGDVFEILVDFKTFREIMEGEQVKKDMLVSGDN